LFTWFRKTWVWVLFVHYLVRPSMVAALFGWPIFLLEQDLEKRLYSVGLIFFLVNIGLNTLFGRALEERMEDRVIRSWKHVSAYLIPNMVRWILEVFRLFLETTEKCIYRVDELLRFRPGDPRASVVWKAFLGTIWFLITYFIRIYINVLVEPQVNPIKHFPVVTVSHKIILPFTVTLVEIFRIPLIPLGPFLADGVAVMTVFLLPGMFGFLVWEFKENWRLYRANRPPEMQGVVVGTHGETVLRLLRPGFYSGTIPRAFTRLRKGQRKGKEIHKYQKAIHHQKESIHHFVERELVHLLRRTPHWDQSMDVKEIQLSSNTIRIIFSGSNEITLEEQSGWLVGSYRGNISSPIFRKALEGFFKISGVDLIRDQIESVLPPHSRYDISTGGITCWPPPDFHLEIFYPLKRILPLSRPRYRKIDFPQPPTPIRMKNLVFRKTPVFWNDWEEFWGDQSNRSPEHSTD
ncbi:MAG: hypothetical protein QF645_07415, partial [Planctomycetota bacterium]|nr:hypothetical protein [Planctomycetota bacterium]